MLLFLILVAVPIIEIALFIQVGGAIGLWPTLLIVIATAFTGTILLRSQGGATLQRLQGSLQTGTNPMDPIAHGAMILVSGVLLLTPGFFTDAFGLSLLLPPVRAFLIKWGSSRIKMSSTIIHTSDMHGQPQRPKDDDVMEGDFTVVEEDPNQEPGNSGWTKSPKD